MLIDLKALHCFAASHLSKCLRLFRWLLRPQLTFKIIVFGSWGRGVLQEHGRTTLEIDMEITQPTDVKSWALCGPGSMQNRPELKVGHWSWSVLRSCRSLESLHFFQGCAGCASCACSFHIISHQIHWFMIHSDSFWFFTTSSASRGWAADSWIPPRLGLKPLRVTWRRNFLREEHLFFHTCGERKTEERHSWQVHTHSMDIRDIRGHSTILHTSQDDVCTFVIPLCLCCPANLHPTFPWKRWLSAQCSVSCRDTSLSNILWRDLQHHDIESIPNQVDEWINSWICVMVDNIWCI